MKYRKLRIAWSVWWGLACALLIVLWVISLSRYSGFQGHLGKQSFTVVSSLGQMNIHFFTTTAVPQPQAWGFFDQEIVVPGEVVMPVPEHFGFEIYPNKAALSFYLSCWMLVLMTGFITAVPWFPYRFSLRTLLIALTLVGLLLGLIIATTR